MTIRNVATGIALTGAVTLGGLFLTPSANAAGTPGTASAGETITRELPGITPDQLERALQEAEDGGFVEERTIDAAGAITTTISLGDGFTFDLVQGDTKERLSAGKDDKGTYVGFNATDQNMIISGAAFALGAALCAVSGGTFCGESGAILTAATVAMQGSGGIRCGTKSLRVYPFAGGKVKPRCA